MFKSTSLLRNINFIKCVSSSVVGGPLLSYDNVTYGMFKIMLIKRWNKETQTGVLLSGIGVELVEPQLVSHLGVQSDWETRQHANLFRWICNESIVC